MFYIFSLNWRYLFAMSLLICSSSKTKAQKVYKTDSVSYLVDTASIPQADRLISIEISPYGKTFSIQCPCLKYGNFPVFSYSLKAKGKFISQAQLKSVKLSSLPVLIQAIKGFTSGNYEDVYAMFVIEPLGKGYIQHQVYLRKPTNHEPTQ